MFNVPAPVVFFVIGIKERGLLFVFLHVVEHVLHVFVVFKFFEKFLDCLALLGSDLLVVVGYALEFSRHDFETGLFEIFLKVGELVECAVDEPFFVFSLKFSLKVHELELEVFERSVGVGLHMEHALMVEEE